MPSYIWVKSILYQGIEVGKYFHAIAGDIPTRNITRPANACIPVNSAMEMYFRHRSRTVTTVNTLTQ